MPVRPITAIPQPSSTLVVVDSRQHDIIVQNEGDAFDDSDSDEELGIILLDKKDQIVTIETHFEATETTLGELKSQPQKGNRDKEKPNDNNKANYNTADEGIQNNIDTTQGFQHYFKSAKANLLTILTLNHHLRLRTNSNSKLNSHSSSNPRSTDR